MLFNTVQYLVFLPMVILIYYMLPARIRYIWLLIASYYFYMQWNPLHVLLLFTCTAITYIGGIIIENRKRQKICLLLCVLFSLGMLGFYKYSGFGIHWINVILSRFRLSPVGVGFDILLPVGISFYTLQALGYLIDVYQGKIHAEKNFLRYALFVAFFPQLVAGPIERSKNLLIQLREYHCFNFGNLKKGILMIVYGLFLKMVIADRAAIIVDTVFNNTMAYPGFYIAVAVLFFAIQIYCDFYGYSTIARGSALIMGIRLMDNFAAPYYSGSIKEFWRRWHISLSSWFRDYLYIPLGGSRKGFVHKEINLFLVFAVSGFWHGASLSFIFWGILHALYQIVSDSFKKIVPDGRTEKLVTFSRRLFRRLVTFLIVAFAWLFFRAGSLAASLLAIKSMISVNNWMVLLDGSLFGLGVPSNYMAVLLMGIFLLFVVDYYKYRGFDVAQMVLRQGWIFQGLTVLFLVMAILLYGCYGELYDVQQFIYFQF